MPTIHVNREQLYAELGQTMTDDQFDELCFEFGIELDEVTSERTLVAKEQGASSAAVDGLSDDVIYRIEIPANRYDLLSVEGLVRALRAYTAPAVGLGASTAAFAKYVTVPGPVTITVAPSVAPIRPFIAAAVLRGVTVTPAIYESLIELQDKLHTGLGRKRTIVSMGTYDLDSLSGTAFVFEACPPTSFSFVPLNRTASLTGAQLVEALEGDLKLKRYLPIIRDGPLYPVLREAAAASSGAKGGAILSLPPIINADACKITLKTRNILIDVTGVDENKVNAALNILVTSFAQYCTTPNQVESVVITHRGEGAAAERVLVTPALEYREQIVSLAYINRSLGLSLCGEKVCTLLRRMMVEATCDGDVVRVVVPPMRTDIIHACDVMEDVAIAYGFNNIPAKVPTTSCVAAPFPLNKLSDMVRREVALIGFTEVLTFSLCSHAENFALLKRPDSGKEAVVLANPKTSDFEVVHTTLIPDMLKTIASNKKMALPIKIFQVADVALLDPTSDVGARNERRLCVAYCGMTSGFEVIHGILDRTMQMLAIPLASAEAPQGGYYIAPSAIPTFFPGRQASVYYDGREIGAFGIVHPDVSSNFDAPYVSSILEISIEAFV